MILQAICRTSRRCLARSGSSQWSQKGRWRLWLCSLLHHPPGTWTPVGWTRRCQKREGTVQHSDTSSRQAGTVKGSEPTFHDPRRGNGSNVHPAHHCLQARALQFWEYGQMRAAVARPLLPFFLSWASLSSRPPAAGNIIAVFLSHDSLIRLRAARELEISSRQAHDHRQSPLPSPVPILF